MLRFIRERVRGRHKKLLHDYIAIFFIMGTVLFLSFFVIGYIADSTAMGQSRGASRVIYKQAREQMEQFEEDLANMQMNVVKDESVLCFLEASDVYERLLALERVQGMVGMNRRINRNLENIIFYDEGGNLIFALGNVFLDKPDLELNEMLNFRGGCGMMRQSRPVLRWGCLFIRRMWEVILCWGALIFCLMWGIFRIL